MGKRSDFIGDKVHRHHQPVRSIGLPPIPYNKPRKLVWMPAIPSWEKEFIYKVGSFTWKRFLELKENTYRSSVMHWDDSAGKEAFDKAKNRFYAETKGLSYPDSPTALDPNLYIDEINSDDEQDVDHELYRELDIVKILKICEDEENAIERRDISIEDIKPTGWDVELDFGIVKDLRGLIVGSDI